MTAPIWADRPLPLAERVRLMALCFDMDDAHQEHRDELVADVAAADRLAQAAVAWFAAVDGPTDEIAIGLRHADIDVALAAYRARKADREEAAIGALLMKAHEDALAGKSRLYTLEEVEAGEHRKAQGVTHG